MLYDPASREPLRAWLIKTLEPICDAEPGALADYVLALLEHEAPEHELRQEFISQLEEFLEKGASDFVDSLFATLRSKSYVPYSSSSSTFTSERPPLDTGIPIPLDALISPSIPSTDRVRKRSLELDDRDARGPPKGPRLSNDGQFSRYPQPNGHGMNGRRDADTFVNGGVTSGMGPGMSRPMNGGVNGGMNGQMGRGQARPRYQPSNNRPGLPDMLPRGVCRDYHIKGYCARGAMCKYSHDGAAVAPGHLPFQGPLSGPLPMPVPFLPMFNNGGMPFAVAAGPQSPAYDPHEAHMDMRPGPSHGGRPPTMRIPMTPRLQTAIGDDYPMSDAQGELPVIQDLTPQRTPDDGVAMNSSRNSFGLGRDTMIMGSMGAHRGGYAGGNYEGHELGAGPLSGPSVTSTVDTTVGSAGAMRPPVGGNPMFRGGMRGGRGRGGTFTGDHQYFRQDHSQDNRTLVVEKIPQEHLSLEAVNGWFKRFGTVTNVAVDVTGAKALVSFMTHDEAEASWKAEDAVFNNRFVKVYWHRPMEGQGVAGARKLQASAPLVANMAARDAQSAVTSTVPEITVPQSSVAPNAEPSVKKSSTTSSNMSALAAKQQLLEKQITEQKELMARLDAASMEDKKVIMARLRKLNEEMKPTLPPTTTISLSTPSRANTSPRDSKERKAKELLDMELDMHANGKDVDDAHESHEELKTKLATLRAEADALGITDAPAHPYQPTYRPYRGRGRGRSSYRGAMRGGMPRANMKLDNRPKALLVNNVNTHDAEIAQSVREWYGADGQVESLDVTDDGIVIHFKSRTAAEQALAKGSDIPLVGSVKLSWHNEPPATRVAPAKSFVSTPSDVPKKQAVGADDRPLSPRPDDVPDETGWGDGEEDGMGMF